MRHPKAIAWEARLKSVFDEIDHRLEERHGELFARHPARPARGETANPEDDGVFNVGAAFSLGVGSRFGPGYILEVRLSTAQRVHAGQRAEIEDETASLLRELLPKAFPESDLRVERDGPRYKIFGDLSLDRAGR
jgi:hypothetical protein